MTTKLPSGAATSAQVDHQGDAARATPPSRRWPATAAAAALGLFCCAPLAAQTFTDIRANLKEVSGASLAWGDFDNDRDLDIQLAGYGNSSRSTRIYRNTSTFADAAPHAPAGLLAAPGAGEAALSWTASSDALTPGADLTHNLRFPSTPGGVDIASPQATTSGWRTVPQLGNAGQGTTTVLWPLPAEANFWSVQAIDTVSTDSPFSAESSFVVSAATIEPEKATIGMAGGTGTIAVTTEPGAQWAAVSSAPSWLAVESGQTGTGSGTVSYSVAANEGPLQRVATIAVAGNDFVLTQLGQFDTIETTLVGVSWSSGAWGDYDSDGDLDIIATGADSAGNPVSTIYRNEGSGVFTDIEADLTGVYCSSVAWGDYDNDGDLDIVLTGYTGSARIAQVYRNDGNDLFTDIGASLTGVSYSSVAWGDYDNDGDLDLLMTGKADSEAISRIYRDDGDGVFTDIGADLPPVERSSVAWGDYDNDGDLDILLTGRHRTGPATFNTISRVYRNDGFGVFTDIQASLRGVESSSVAWGDYDNDSDLDILLTGYPGGGSTARVYRNDGNGVFTDISAGLAGADFSAVAWGDYDNDGDLDIVLSGSGPGSFAKVYRNLGDDAFADLGTLLTAVTQGLVAWGDYDNDGDLDILLTGSSANGPVAQIVRNNAATPNSIPSAPVGLSSSHVAGQVPLSWLASNDPETPSAGLTHNLRVSTTPGGVNILSPMASTSTGQRRVPRLGSANHATTAFLDELPAGTYYWSVQAVDTAFAGSPFAGESSFVVSSATIAPPSATFPVAGGAGTVSIATDAGASWEATSRAPTWLIVTLGSQGTGNGTVEYKVLPNRGLSRVGVIVIAGHSFKVTQLGLFADSTVALPAVYNGAVAWGDYDGDGDLDILLTGNTFSERITRVYRNDGAGVFTDIRANLVGVDESSVAWGDYDNDGDLDILLAGHPGYTPVAKVYRNDGGVFTDIVAGLKGIDYASVGWGDYDNDGDLDILLAGGFAGAVASVYRNDGGGVFTDIQANLQALYYPSAAWGDYDNDGDLDILLAGDSSSGDAARVYRNEGAGVFSLVASVSCETQPSVAWGDFDSDGDLDFLVSGRVYRNDGGDHFALVANLVTAGFTCVSWGDYDNDGDLDILASGKIFRNDGSGHFAEIPTGFPSVSRDAAAWGDYDNDGDLDVLLTGQVSAFVQAAGIFRNESPVANSVPNSPTGLSAPVGGGQVTLAWAGSSDSQTASAGLTYNLRVSATPGGIDILSPMASTVTGWRRVAQRGAADGGTSAVMSLAPGTYYWSVQAVDTALAGSQFASESAFTITAASIDPTTALFPVEGGSGTINVAADGSSSWVAVSHAPSWLTVTSGSSGIGDGSVAYSAARNYGLTRTGTMTIAGQVFSVTQLGLFGDTAAALEGVYYSSVAWGDYDNDGDLDLLLTGFPSHGVQLTKLYQNNNSTLAEVATALPGVTDSAVAWGDFDADGDLDILLTGRQSGSSPARVYRNDGGRLFTDIAAGLADVITASVAWGDYDNDGDLDIVLAGYANSAAVTKIYRNDGGGVFTDIVTALPRVDLGSVAWGDYDNDGDLDLLLTGSTSLGRIASVYRNDGAGVFTDISGGLPGVSGSSAAWGDYDNDGDLDILLTGYTGSARIAKVFRNDGHGVFTDTAAPLTGVDTSSVAWGDLDNDGDLDILLTGDTGSAVVSKVYRNNGGAFVEAPTGLPGLDASSVALGDYDDDGDLDILMTGADSGYAHVSKLYRNESPVANTVPAAPNGLNVPVGAGEATLIWSRASDVQTPSAGLTYNLRVSTTPGGVNVLSPMASVESGWRRVPQLGSAGHGTTAIVGGLPAGTYFWSVQAIDSAFSGSPFAGESSFTITTALIDPTAAVFASSGGSGSVSVTTDPGVTWTAVSHALSWLSITGGSSGAGNGNVGYSVLPNIGAPRQATITIAGRVFTVDQEAATHTLVVSKTGTGSGTVTSNPVGIDCGATCSASFSHGTVIALSQSASDDSTFGGWSGGCSGTGACSVTMDQAQAVTATFTAPCAPSITSADHATFAAELAGTFTVIATGTPTPSLSSAGALPSGVAFTDTGSGAATLAGTPEAGTEGAYPLNLTAHNGVGSDATQAFTLTVAAHPTGDVNGDGDVNVQDVFSLINYLFAGGPAPFGAGDVNGDTQVNVQDVFHLINYLFAGGPHPADSVPGPDANIWGRTGASYSGEFSVRLVVDHAMRTKTACQTAALRSTE